MSFASHKKYILEHQKPSVKPFGLISSTFFGAATLQHLFPASCSVAKKACKPKRGLSRRRESKDHCAQSGTRPVSTSRTWATGCVSCCWDWLQAGPAGFGTTDWRVRGVSDSQIFLMFCQFRVKHRIPSKWKALNFSPCLAGNDRGFRWAALDQLHSTTSQPLSLSISLVLTGPTLGNDPIRPRKANHSSPAAWGPSQRAARRYTQPSRWEGPQSTVTWHAAE